MTEILHNGAIIANTISQTSNKSIFEILFHIYLTTQDDELKSCSFELVTLLLERVQIKKQYVETIFTGLSENWRKNTNLNETMILRNLDILTVDY